MNPRRVHALMNAGFPGVDPAKSSWVNLLERDGSLRGSILAGLIDAYLPEGELLVEVNRGLGDVVPRRDVVAYVDKYAGQGDIRIADRAFRGYVLVARSGVATGGYSTTPQLAASTASAES